MATKENFLPKTLVVNSTDIAAGLNIFSWRGSEHRKFVLQLKLVNMTCKIWSSIIKKPGATGWVDQTTFFTGAATITTSQQLQQTSDLKVLWWKITWERSNANNAVRIDLLEYDRDKVD